MQAFEIELRSKESHKGNPNERHLWIDHFIGEGLLEESTEKF